MKIEDVTPQHERVFTITLDEAEMRNLYWAATRAEQNVHGSWQEPRYIPILSLRDFSRDLAKALER